MASEPEPLLEGLHQADEGHIVGCACDREVKRGVESAHPHRVVGDLPLSVDDALELLPSPAR
jgi:hypothetical protein